jgi:signal transduction histidine kinase
MKARWWGRVVAGLGILLTVGAFWHIFIGDGHQSLMLLLVDVCVLGGFALSFLYVGLRHARRPMDAERYPRIFAWMIGGGLLFAAVGVVIIYAGSRYVAPNELQEALQLSGSVGLAAGLFIGTIEARELTTAAAAARAEAKTEALQAEKERIEHLNDLMRHYILNGANIIGGYTDELKPSVAPEEAARLDTIAERADTMATLVEHMRTLTAVDQGDFTEAEVNLAQVLESAAASRHESAVTVTLPRCDLTVRANELLTEALSLLFDALATSAEDGGSLVVDCAHTAQTVTLTVTATPAELPAPVERSIFDPVGPGIGLEFYLASELLDPYVDVELTQNAHGTVQFELVFDRVRK